jgi:hypothetical protein
VIRIPFKQSDWSAWRVPLEIKDTCEKLYQIPTWVFTCWVRIKVRAEITWGLEGNSLSLSPSLGLIALKKNDITSWCSGGFREGWSPPPFLPEIYHLILIWDPKIQEFFCYFRDGIRFLELPHPLSKFLDPPRLMLSDTSLPYITSSCFEFPLYFRLWIPGPTVIKLFEYSQGNSQLKWEYSSTIIIFSDLCTDEENSKLPRS